MCVTFGATLNERRCPPPTACVHLSTKELTLTALGAIRSAPAVATQTRDALLPASDAVIWRTQLPPVGPL